MKVTGLLLASATVLGLFCSQMQPASAKVLANPPGGGSPPPAQMAGPSAWAGADISNVSSDWGKQPWTENEVGVGTDPDIIGQGDPYIAVVVGGSTSGLKFANVDSTVVFYYSGNGTPSSVTFDAVLSVGDTAYTSKQTAHSSVSYAPGVAAATETGDDNMVSNPQMYPHNYSHSQTAHMTETLDEFEQTIQVKFHLSAGASNQSD